MIEATLYRKRDVFIPMTEDDRQLCHDIEEGVPLRGKFTRKKVDQRTVDQNKKMWAMLSDIAKQVNWYGNYLTKEDWKDILSASLKKQKAVPGINGGFVVLGARTSKMSIKEMIDMIELMYVFGVEHNIVWTKKKSMEDYE